MVHTPETLATVFKLPRKEQSAGPGPSQNLEISYQRDFFPVVSGHGLKKQSEGEGACMRSWVKMIMLWFTNTFHFQPN